MSHDVCLLASTPPGFTAPPPRSSRSQSRHITQQSRPQRPCHAPLLASSHLSRRVAAQPSTHWLSAWWESGWQTPEVLMRTNGSHAGWLGSGSVLNLVDSAKMGEIFHQSHSSYVKITLQRMKKTRVIGWTLYVVRHQPKDNELKIFLSIILQIFVAQVSLSKVLNPKPSEYKCVFWM